MSLEPQNALEQAVVNLMQTSTGSGGLGYTSANCGRMFDGRPPPVHGLWFASVWYDGQRAVSQNRSGSTSLDEEHGVYVTVTFSCVKPFDRWFEHRDELELKANDIRSAIHKDIYNNSIINAANTLAGFRSASATPSSSNVGFFQGLRFDGMEMIQLVGPDWFNASVDSRRLQVGIAQRLRFRGAMRIQNLANME